MVIHHFICYGDCSCSTYVAGSRGKTIHLFQKFSSTGESVTRQTDAGKLENPNVGVFLQKKSKKSIFSIKKKKIKNISVFISFLFNFLFTSKMSGQIQYVLWQFILFPICTQFLSIFQKDGSGKKNKKKKSILQIFKWLLPISALLKTH